MMTIIVFAGLAGLSPALQSSPPAKASSSASATRVKIELQDKARTLYGDDNVAITFVSNKSFQDMTSAGDVESGVVLKEAPDKSEIFLDKDPCKGRMISFHKPYTKQSAGTVRCGGTDFPKVTVTQR